MRELLVSFSLIEWLLLGLIFIWTGFVRTGLGFGGAALGLPLMLLLGESPIFWLPIIGIHLLFFSSLTLRNVLLHKVDWHYLKQSLVWILPFALIGVFGLIKLPSHILILIVYCITFSYALMWIFNVHVSSKYNWIDKFLLILGGYIAGLSLTGAPLIVAVYMRYIAKHLLRNTLFTLWFILVSIKMSAFIAFGININWQIALILLPIAYIGHFIGLKTHEYILQNQILFTRVLGIGLILVSSLGIIKVSINN